MDAATKPANHFDTFFTNARDTALLIFNTNGEISDVNQAFCNLFGYQPADLLSKPLAILFCEKDRQSRKPEIEINTTLRQGSSADDNYLVQKDGSLMWVSGESVLIDETRILKIIKKMDAYKQLDQYLLGSSELLDHLFNSVKAGLILLDAQLRVIRLNDFLFQMFSLENKVPAGVKIKEIPHDFWQRAEIVEDLRRAIIHGKKVCNNYIDRVDKDTFRKLNVTMKTIIAEQDATKQLLLVVRQED